MRRISTAALLLGIGAFAGCEALPQIEEGKCGNQVKEAGEECDSPLLVPDPSDNGEFWCITPGKDNACHYTCAVVDGVSKGCPPGMACGDDEVCRTAGGLFAEPETLVTSGAIRLQTAYFDKDGWLDLVAVGQEAISVHYLEENARWDSSYEIPSTPTVPSVMHRVADPAKPSDDDSKLPALVINVGTGLAVLTGRPERSLLPKVYDAFSVPGFEWFLAADALPGQVGDELVVIGDWQGATSVLGTSFKDAGKPTKLYTLPTMPAYDGVEGVAAVAKLYTQGQCESVALMFTGGNSINIFSPCASDAWNTSAAPIVIPLDDAAERRAWGGVFAVHLNDDDLLDLAVGSQDLDGANRRLEFYLADPETGNPAQFVPSLEWPPIPEGSRTAACGSSADPNAPRITSFPLAIGDINEDGHFDIVDASGMLLSRNDGWLPRSCTVGSDWVMARIGRFNGDGFPDVALVSRESNGTMGSTAAGPMSVEFHIGAGGGLFNPFVYPAMGEVADIFAGDFDGDVIHDLVVRETAGATGAPVLEDRLNLFFGSFAGGPEGPAPLGTLSAVKQIAVGKTVESDGLDDLMIVSEADAQGKSGVKIMPGNTSRRVLSPLFLVRPDGEEKRLNRPKRLCTVRSAPAAGEVTNGIISIAEEITEEGTTTLNQRSELWRVVLDGSADVSADPGAMDYLDVTSELPDPGVGLLLAALDAVEDDGGAKNDEVVAFVPIPGGTTGIVVATVDGMLTSPGMPEDTGLRIRYEADGMDAPMLVNDFDGNGWADVALLLEEDPEKGAGLVVFWNHLAGCSTGICAANRSELRLSDVGLMSAVGALPVRVIDMAFLDVGDGDQKELALLLDRGVFLFNVWATDGLPVFVPRQLGADDLPAAVEGTQQLRGRSLAAFDADHDGLEDLIIGTDNEIALLRAKWVTQ